MIRRLLLCIVLFLGMCFILILIPFQLAWEYYIFLKAKYFLKRKLTQHNKNIIRAYGYGVWYHNFKRLK